MKRALFTVLALTACAASAQLKEKVYKYMPLEKDLSVVSATGERSMDAVFSRASTAMDPDFKVYAANEPRFYKGQLLMETGGKSSDRGSRNLLSAKEDPFDKSGAKVQAVKGMTPGAFSFDGKIALKPVKLGIKKGFLGTHFVFSFYAKGNGALKVAPETVLVDGSKKALSAESFVLTNEWKRYFVLIDGGSNKVKPTTVDSFSAAFEGKDVSIDAAMLETPSSYFMIETPTTYIPNGAFRAADKLRFPVLTPEMSTEGAFAFNVTLTTNGGWQSLMSISSGWKNDLELDYKNTQWGGRLVFSFRNQKNAWVKAPMKLGEKHHVIFNYTKDTVTIYVDGEKKGSFKCDKVAPFKFKHVNLGSKDIEVQACALFSNFTIFKKALTDEEAAGLAKKPQGDVAGKAVACATPFSVFPVNAGKVNVRFQANKELESFTAKLGGYSIVKTSLSGKNAVCTFDPALLMPGKYDLQVECVFTDGSKENASKILEICNALRPKDLLQVNTWGESGPNHEKYGVTMFSTGLDPFRIDNAARQGLYGTFNFNCYGLPRPGHAEDVILTCKGKPGCQNARSEYIRQDVVRSAEALAEQIKDAPTFMTLVLNSEKSTGSSGGPNIFNFSQEEIQRAAKFGLDLKLWLPKGVHNEMHYNFQPVGYLGVKPIQDQIPANGVIPDNYPFYAYHLDRHSSNGGTDVVLNDLLAKTILKVRPDMIMIQDPVLRRPALRSYKEINNAADWCYYLDMNVVVDQAERLGCITRGNPNMTATTMPQFLFKEGTAAPYAGLPPHEMFREASYLAVSRPTNIVTYWNACSAFDKGKSQTVEEIEAILGTGGWKETAQAMKKVKGKRIYCYVPELTPEFKRLSDTLWYPFGGLFPKWKNAPRKAAVVRSFCCDLFGAVRWPGHENSELAHAFVKLGIPYDTLYDQDLMEGNLSGYDLIILPDAFALPESAVKNLLAYQKRGGLIVADQRIRVQPLKEVATILQVQRAKADKAYTAKAKELYELVKGKTDSPAYIEGMQTLEETRAASAGVEGLAELARKSIKADFACVQDQVYWNHLQAAGANYLFAINDLRIPGRVYGKFGKVREKGIARKVEFLVRNPEFRYAYDLSFGKEIPVKNGKVSFELGPCMGKILLFTSQKSGKLSVKCDGGKRGELLTAEVRIENGSGLIPVTLDLFGADGKKLSLSRSDVVKNGVLRRSWTIPLNAPEGEWSLTVRELAQGQSVSAKIPLR